MFFRFLNSVGAGHEVNWEVTKTKLDDIPELVAELPVSNDSFDVEVD
jgi:hypothetical protein